MKFTSALSWLMRNELRDAAVVGVQSQGSGYQCVVILKLTDGRKATLLVDEYHVDYPLKSEGDADDDRQAP